MRVYLQSTLYLKKTTLSARSIKANYTYIRNLTVIFFLAYLRTALAATIDPETFNNCTSVTTVLVINILLNIRYIR